MSDIEAVGSLADPVRRRLYAYVVAQEHAVGRVEAAAAIGAQRTLAAFHLDKLVESGLLETTSGKVSGRDGPGSGRPAKLYRRASGQLTVQLPPRDYETAAHLFAEALERSGGDDALHTTAREEGARRGAALQAGDDGPPAIADLLHQCGYEPAASEAGTLELRNCPFHTLSRDYPPLACGMNLELLRGLLSGAGRSDAEARMEAAPGRCCVVVSFAESRGV